MTLTPEMISGTLGSSGDGPIAKKLTLPLPASCVTPSGSCAAPIANITILLPATFMSVLDVMIAVGGLTDFADGNKARIFRVADGGKLYSVRLRDLVKRGDISANVDIRPGDIVIIPQSWF